MYINDRDQVNYHGFLHALREMNHATQQEVSKGICTISGVNRFENGNRMAEKLMGDRLTARLGISGEKYEDYLQPPQFAKWEHRMRIIRAIEKRDLEEAKRELDAYAEIPKPNCLNKQFVETMRFMLLTLENAPEEELLACIKKAVKCTVPNVNKALAGEHLLADQEVNLILELMRLTQPKKVVRDVRAWRITEYKKLITYIENSNWETLLKAKIYPKVVFYICQLLLEEEASESEYLDALDLCHTAIELLRDTGRLYYFVELIEARQIFAQRLIDGGASPSKKQELEEMIQEITPWEEVLKGLYKRYEVDTYMSDFCYLYYETECHNMVTVIEARRKMLKLSRAKLADGICSDRTIIRFEREGRNPKIELVRLMFEKMGMCAEYRRARVITNDANMLMLSNEVIKNMNNFEFEEWEENLAKLEAGLRMGLSYNRQEISRVEALRKFWTKQVDKEEFKSLVMETLEHTLPLSALELKKDKHLTRSEITCLFDLMMKTKDDLTEKAFEIIYDRYGKIEDASYAPEICVYEFVMGGVVGYLGEIRRHEEAYRVSGQLVKECLSCRRIGQLMNILYAIVWNYTKLNETPEIHCQKELLKEGLVISIIAKKSARVAFFQKKLLELQ